MSSYFAGGAWRNATSVLAQATATTNNVSVSRQESTDETISGGAAERRPLLRAQTDPLVKLASQNSSRTSLAPEVDPAAGRRFTFRGVARALPYFLRAAPEPTTTTEGAERAILSSSPPSQETLIDLVSKAPVKRSTLAQEVIPPTENGSDHSESPLSDTRTDSAESTEDQPVPGRKSTSSSTGSTIVTDEPQPISSSPEDDLSEVKKRAAITLGYSSLQSRIQELQTENGDKASQLRLSQEAQERERREREKIQSDMVSQRTEIDQLRLSLETARDQSRETGEKVLRLEREIDVLRQKVSARDMLVEDKDSQLRDLVSEKSTLQGVITQLESEKQFLEKNRFNLEAEIAKTRGTSDKAFSNLTATYEQNAAQATNTIRDLQSKLTSSTTKINQLQTSLDSSSRTIDSLSKTVEERTADVHRLEQAVSDLRTTKRALTEKVEEQGSQMMQFEQTAKAERAELCQKHVLDIETERRIVRNLQSSLESLQLEMGVTEAKVSTLTREKSGLLEKVGKLEERCKGGEQQIDGLRADLTKASAAVRDLENKNKALREEARKEKAMLINQTNQQRRQLDDVQKQSTERQERIQRLDSTINDLKNTLLRAQTSVTEKDQAIGGLQRKNASLEDVKEDLQRRLVGMERTLADAKETAQSVLDKATKTHDRDMTHAKARIQELQDELSSFITTAQQLHSSLASSRAETEKVQQIAEDREQEIHRLREGVTSLQDAVRSLETKNEETLSQINSMEHAARDEKAAILRKHSAEMDTQQRAAQGLKDSLQRALKEKEGRIGSLSIENGTLRAEVSAIKEKNQKYEGDINAARVTLRDVSQRNKSSIERLEHQKVKAEDELERLRSRIETLEQELKKKGAEIERLNQTTFQKIGSGFSSALGGFWSLAGASSSVAANHPGSILTQAH